jgi:hypothetical protein
LPAACADREHGAIHRKGSPFSNRYCSSPRPKRRARGKIFAPTRRATNPDLEVQQRVVESEQKEQRTEREKLQSQCDARCRPRRRQSLAHPSNQEDAGQSKCRIGNKGGLPTPHLQAPFKLRHRYAVQERRRIEIKAPISTRPKASIAPRTGAHGGGQIANQRRVAREAAQACPVDWSGTQPSNASERPPKKQTPLLVLRASSIVGSRTLELDLHRFSCRPRRPAHRCWSGFRRCVPLCRQAFAR